MKKIISSILALAMVTSLFGCSSQSAAKTTYDGEKDIVLSDDGITVDGAAATEDSTQAVWISHDIVYYHDTETYDDGYAYGEGTESDMHTRDEADAHTVVNITEAGTYRISGTLSAGQIAVNLGDDAETNPDAVVTLVFDGADITCTVAPAVIFYSVYECDTEWVAYDNGDAENYEADSEKNTEGAGANVIIADGSVNNINGSYVAKIYKDAEGEKKLCKYDGAFYSKMSMNVDGESAGDGVLNITAENEGLDSELHLTINGGVVNIFADNDGINTNEDNVSVTTINGGELHILAGLGAEGDGVDSNGYLVINGGIVVACANPGADSGLDSDLGSYINGGTVIALGSTMDWAESDSDQVTMNVQFAESQSADEAIVITDADGKVVFAYDPDKDETAAENIRSYTGAIISCSGLTVGESYCLYVGGDITGTETNGIYDASTVTAFTGIQQCYTGTNLGGMGGGMAHSDNGDFGEGMPDDSFDPSQNGDIPEMPADGNVPEMPDGGDFTPPENGEMPEKPSDDSFTPDNDGEMPERPSDDSFTPDDDGTAHEKPEGNMPQGGHGGMTDGADESTGEEISLFEMTDKVNAFSGVRDVRTV